MDAERILTDAPTLRSFVETFVDLTTANIEAQREAVARLRALLDGENPRRHEYPVTASRVQVGDVLLWDDENPPRWRTVVESHSCEATGTAQNCWFLAFSDRINGVHVDCAESFTVLRVGVEGSREGTPAA